MVLVDTSVLLDVLTADPRWSAWSEEKLVYHAEREVLAINPIIYAEVSLGFLTIEVLDEALSPGNFQRLPLPYDAGFSPPSASSNIVVEVARNERRCLISTLALTPPLKVWPCLPVTLLAIERTFHRSRRSARDAKVEPIKKRLNGHVFR